MDTDEDHLEADIAVDRLEVLEDTVEEVVEVQVEDTREEVLLLEKEDIAGVLQVVLVVDTEVALRVEEAVDTVEEVHLDDQADIAVDHLAVPVDHTEAIEMIVEILQDVHTTHNKKRGNMPLFLCKYFFEFFFKYFYRKLFCALETSIFHRISSRWSHPLDSLHDLIQSEIWRHKYASFTIYYCVLESTFIDSYEGYAT